MDVTTFGAELVIAIMQLLFVIVEDNPLAIKKVRSTSERQLRDLLFLESSDPSALLIKTLTGGIIINICGGDITSLPIDVLNQIFAVLAQTLSADHKLVCNELSSSVPLCDADGKVVSPKGKEALQLDDKIKSVSRTLDSQQTAIEIIANICSCEGMSLQKHILFTSCVCRFMCRLKQIHIHTDSIRLKNSCNLFFLNISH